MTLYLNYHIHIAWANDTSGTDFTIRPDSSSTYSYIGVYTDYSSTASSDYSNYEWIALGENVVGRVQSTTPYYYLTDEHSIDDKNASSYESGDWSTEKSETTTEKPCLWSYSVLTLSNGATVTTNPKLYAHYNTIPFTELSDILSWLPENTTRTPYEITITDLDASNVRGFGATNLKDGTIQYVLINNNKKYVSIMLNCDETITNMIYCFYSCKTLVSFNSSGLENVTNANNMFDNCENLTSIDTSGFVNVTSANYMFFNCTSLSSIDTSPFVNVTNASFMFTVCENLTSIDTSPFVNVTNASGMFAQCLRLTSIDTSSFKNVTSANNMFLYCENLTSIDVSALTSVIECFSMFWHCSNLLYITGGEIFSSNIARYDDIFTDCKSLRRIFCNTEANVSLTKEFLTNYSKPPATFDVSTMVRQGVDFSKLNDTLASLDANTANTPYEMNILNYTSDNLLGSTGAQENTFQYILSQNSSRYITLNCILDDNDNIDYSAVYVNNKFLNKTDKTDFNYSFLGCSNLVAVALGEKATITSYLFCNCINLKYYYLNVSNVTSANYMFFNCTSLSSIDTSPFENVTNANNMFDNCLRLTSIDTSGFVNVTSANYMFFNCTSLSSIDTSPFVNVTNASGMFSDCTSLSSIDTSPFENVTNANRMFANCLRLTSIDTSSFKNVTSANNMFYGCENLTKITNWAIDINKLSSYSNIFINCPSNLKIYLKDNITTIDNVFSLVRLNITSDGTLSVTKQSTDETQVTSSNSTVIIGDTIRFTGKIDEISVADEISDTNFNTMFKYRYEWSSNKNDILPTNNSFVLWAKDSNNVKTNIINESTATSIIKSTVEKIVFPVGFVYTQYSGTSSPAKLGLKIAENCAWVDITSKYTGAFFRAYYSSSGSFSDTSISQQSSQLSSHKHTIDHEHTVSTSVSNAHHVYFTGSKGHPSANANVNTDYQLGGNSNTSVSVSVGSYSGSSGPTGSSELRPRNVAIKIWQVQEV